MCRSLPFLRLTPLLLLACAPLQAQAVEIDGMKGFENLYGRYAPAGDCKRLPRIVVDAGGMTFEVAATKAQITNPEFAASYFGGAANTYEGISKVFFPFRTKPDYYPIMMTFNADEKRGVLVITGHEEGWKGGPPLAPRNQMLVSGSPYSRCK